MSWIRDEIRNRVLRKVEIVYLDRSIATMWNRARRGNEPPTFTGFYWVNGREEGGPFKSRSSAIRDAYYRLVLKREPPAVGRQTRDAY